TDIAAYAANLESIEDVRYPYVVIAPSYMVYTQDYDALLQTHIESGADITLLYHAVDNAKESHLSCDTLNLNRQKGVLSIEPNRGSAKSKNIFMDTYVMKKDLFIELIKKAQKLSSLYTLVDVINAMSDELDVRGVPHRGYFASITEFKSYYDANLALIDHKAVAGLFNAEWPIYTRTNDSCPAQYFESAEVKNSVVSNGCIIEGTVENCVVGRGAVIKKGAVVKNCVILPDSVVGANAHLENLVLDKHAKVIRVKEIIATPENPGYVARNDVL
ncbi:MAG: glucose-1-phosphate adenylyltransferase subunit GlgD, partial [Dorea sp.]